jgi:SAM-dependent methyltransferase
MRTLFRATDRLYRVTPKEFYVVECGGCRLIRLYPWPEPSELQDYHRRARPDSPQVPRAFERLALSDHVRFVSSAVQRPARLLDVGCAAGGLFARMLSERGYQCVVAAYSCDTAAVPVVRCDLASAPFAPGTFKAVTMFHVLEHLYDPSSHLHAAHRLLQRDGKLIVQASNAASWQFLLFGESWSGLDVPRRLVSFRTRDLDSLIESCGFEILRHKHFALRDNPSSLALTLAPSLARSTGLRRDVTFAMLYLAALPITALEAACRAGAAVIVEARKR